MKDYDAKGDGITDDTIAIQSTLSACINSTFGGTVFFPSGLYLVTSTLFINSSVPLQFRGEGWSSNILWSSSTDLFVWLPPGGSNDIPAHVVLDSFAISCVDQPKILTNTTTNSTIVYTAIKFTSGVVRSVFSTILFYGRGNIPATPYTATLCGNNFDLGPLTDTVTLRDVLHWFVGGTGVSIGRGSEVRVFGGRIIGQALRNDSSIGVHVTGNNGGVHIAETDVIGLDTGVWIENSSGAGSNREIFITHATMDSNGIGLRINDDSYTSIAGCWTASSDRHQILMDNSATGAHLVVVGGTIFNGGVLGGDCSEIGQECNGITVRAGQFSLSGVLIWANKRIGIWVPNPLVIGYSITGNRLQCNHQGVNLSGTAYAATSNVVLGSTVTDNWGNGTGAVIANNVEADFSC